MQRRFKKNAQANLEEYITFFVESMLLENMTTEQRSRELSIFTLTLLSAKIQPKTLSASA
jgi:hypothetical protein